MNKPDKKLIFETIDERTVYCLASQVVAFRQESKEYVVFLESGETIRCRAKETYYKELMAILDEKCDDSHKMSNFEQLMSDAALIKLNDPKADLGMIICNIFNKDECILCPLKPMCRKNNGKEVVNEWLRKEN